MPIGRDPFSDEVTDLTEHLLAIRHFTDREDALAAFERHLQAPEAQTLPVLSFYGVGGVGKSLLLRKLMHSLGEAHAGLPFAHVDFDDDRRRDPVNALTALKVQLESSFDLRFPEFDLVHALLAVKEGASAEALGGAGVAFRAALDIVSPFVPGVGQAAVAAAQHAIKAVASRWPGLERKAREMLESQQLQRLRAMESPDLLGQLVRAFAKELCEAAPPRAGHACRAVLFLDTYEKLWTGPAGPADPHGAEQDAWVRRLYSYLAHCGSALLVIAGRDALAWVQVDPDWRALDPDGLRRYLDAHLIGGLSPEDTQRYLARCGVGHPPDVGPPTPLQEAIVGCAADQPEVEGCHPFYVGLCANIVLNERGEAGTDPDPGTFAGIPSHETAHRLAFRFLRSLRDPTHADLVRSLSIPRWFDLPLVAGHLGVSANVARPAYQAFARFSFTEVGERGELRMHSVMREALQYLLGEDAPDRVLEMHEWCRAHWQARHEAGETVAEAEAWFHWLHLEPKRAVEHWSGQAKQACESRDAPRGRFLASMQEGIDLTTDRWAVRFGGPDWAWALSWVGHWLDGLRRFARQQGPMVLDALHCYEAALQVYTEAEFPDDWARTQNNLGASYEMLPTGDRGTNLQKAIECYAAALRVHTETDFPVNWATTQNNLGIAYQELPTGDREANLQRAIGCYEAAFRVYTEAAFPLDWAKTQSNLGTAYQELPTGDQEANLQRAIGCYEAALEVYTETEFPSDWARTQICLGSAYGRLPTGDRGANLQKAIRCYEAALRVYAETEFPVDWATTQNNLGTAYGQLPTGDRGANLQKAIECCAAALRVHTEADFPVNWATAQSNLGIAYRELPTGDRGANLEKAIECCAAALRVYTEAAFPRAWARTQTSLGSAYQELPTGDRGANLQQSIECCAAALRVYAEAEFPSDWARTQNNLGNAYALLPTGDRSANLQQAIRYYEAALRVYTETELPVAWAGTQNNLGIAYALLPTGDRSANLQRAIRCYEAATKVHTETEFPVDWAGTQSNLGTAYRDLPTGDRGANLQQAIRCYEAALRVCTEAEFPVDWATTQNNLGIAYRELPTGDRGANVQRAIGCYEAALRVYTETEFPSDWATTQDSLGNAYEALPTGDRGANLQQAIGRYEAALRVHTEAAFPRGWARTQNNLGTAYLQIPTGDRGANLQQAIGCYEAALRVFTEEVLPHHYRIAIENLALAQQALAELERTSRSDDGP